MNIDGLEREIRELFDKNRVTLLRSGRRVSYHAPYLKPKIEYPTWVPDQLHWLWRIWCRVIQPLRVNYPHQWFWDSCAHAITLSHLNPQLALMEIESLLSTQREDGFIPHMIWNKQRMHWLDRIFKYLYHAGPGSPYIQPPILAEAVESIYHKTKDKAFLSDVLPALHRYYSYLALVRTRGNDGLAEIIISYESKDRGREYDVIYGESNAKHVLLGPMTKMMIKHRLMGWDIDRIFASNLFRVKDLLFNCIYAQNMFSLSRLYGAIGAMAEQRLFEERAKKVEASILSKMYDESTGLFYSLDARYGQDKQIKVSTISSLMPIVLEGIDEPKVRRLVMNYLYNPVEFWLAYPVPIDPLSSGHIKMKANVIWRGLQTWILPNWYIVRGLRKQAKRFSQSYEEYNKIADELTLKTYEMVSAEGFREFYNSETGKGHRARDFGMSTLVLDMVRSMKSQSSSAQGNINPNQD